MLTFILTLDWDQVLTTGPRNAEKVCRCTYFLSPKCQNYKGNPYKFKVFTKSETVKKTASTIFKLEMSWHSKREINLWNHMYLYSTHNNQNLIFNFFTVHRYKSLRQNLDTSHTRSVRNPQTHLFEHELVEFNKCFSYPLLKLKAMLLY